MLELRVAGPGLDVVRRLDPGEPELLLGRDPACGICLPDPQRNVSRRHVAVWNVNGQLNFRVDSSVNGVEMAFGEAPPGARGVLPLGQAMRIAEYTLTVQERQSAGDTDPWAVFEDEGSGTVARPLARSMITAALTGGFKVADDDPFGEWGFETTFGPGSTAGELPPGQAGPATGPQAGGVVALLRGLGLPAGDLAHLGEAELEAFGRTLRLALLGLVDQRRLVGGVKRSLHAEERTMLVERGQENPLDRDWPPNTMLRYLLAGGPGFMAPERAVGELLGEVAAHHLATGQATTAAIEGTIREFDPAALRDRLLGQGGKLFEGARAWDAFGKHFNQQAADMPAWVQQLMDKYFTEHYMRATLAANASPRDADA